MTHAQLEKAAIRRQRILDYLAAHPGSKMPRVNEVLRALGDDGNAFNTIRTMTDWGEVRFEGIQRTRRYYALVQTTRSADESCRIRLSNAEAANVQRHQQAVIRITRNSASCYVHKPSHKPIPNQGGQGCVRRATTIDCQQNY